MFDIVTVGHFSIDYIRPPGRRVSKPALGGPPTYVSLAAGKLGAKVSVVSKVGEDFSPSFTEWLKKQGVDLSGLKKVAGASTTSYALNYSTAGERQLVLRSRGPPIEPEDMEGLAKAKAIHVAPIANEIGPETVARLRTLTSLLSMDPQGFLRRFKEDGTMYLEGIRDPEIVRGVDVFKASQREIEAVTGESSLENAVKKVHQLGAKIVVMTKGPEGSLVYVKNRLYRVPASKPKAVVDTTGSGDVFIGAFLAEYVKGKDPLWCASVGSAMASFVVEKIGPRGFGSRKGVYERAAQVHERISVVSQNTRNVFKPT